MSSRGHMAHKLLNFHLDTTSVHLIPVSASVSLYLSS